MGFFSNKHVIIAMIVAPILAILSYYFVDTIVKEKPHQAVSGASYPLSAKSNCRYTSGRCNLENASFKTFLVVTEQDDQQVLILTSSHALQGAKVGFNTLGQQSDETSTNPLTMRSVSEDNKKWSIVMPMNADANTQLMLAMLANGSRYYAETTMGFSKYETTFNKNFNNG
jgi:hypothetical protein